MIKLLNCPFCGTKARHFHTDSTGRKMIVCTNDDCCMALSCNSMPFDQWQARSDKSDELRKALADCSYQLQVAQSYDIYDEDDRRNFRASVKEAERLLK